MNITFLDLNKKTVLTFFNKIHDRLCILRESIILWQKRAENSCTINIIVLTLQRKDRDATVYAAR